MIIIKVKSITLYERKEITKKGIKSCKIKWFSKNLYLYSKRGEDSESTCVLQKLDAVLQILTIKY